MAQTINNTASTRYSFSGSSDVFSASSNNLPINLQDASGLVITKTASPDTFVPGEIINYTVTITNNSGSYLNGVRIIDNLGGNNLAYVLSSASLQSTTTYPVTPIATNPLTFTLQELASGETMTLRYRSQVVFNLPSNVSLITNTVQGIGYTQTGTISGFANETITRRTETDFSITKTASVTDASPSQIFNYYLTLTNNTNSVATPVTVTDSLPDNFELVSASLQIGNGAETPLSSTDYTLTPSNDFSLPSSTGPVVSVPANSSTLVTLTGYLT